MLDDGCAAVEALEGREIPRESDEVDSPTGSRDCHFMRTLRFRIPGKIGRCYGRGEDVMCCYFLNSQAGIGGIGVDDLDDLENSDVAGTGDDGEDGY